MSTPPTVITIPWTPENQREAHRLLGALANDLAGMAGSLAACDRHPDNPPPPGLLSDITRTLLRLQDVARTLLPPGPDIQMWPDGSAQYTSSQVAKLKAWREAFPSWAKHADALGTMGIAPFDKDPGPQA
ncbi:hypothetical protein [Luteitalea sp.]|uniref:hypothetical protein n=1 Tax=Luteitalea sp. TaxID=2004800 RepID=UPI0025C2450F|nr:hypothetical protein [Luteitalea sp.]